MKIPLYGVPRHLWEMVTGLFNASGPLVLWRVFLLITAVLASYYVYALTGGTGLTVIILGFAITSILSYTLRDDILAIWRDLWNAQWAEAEV